MYQASQRLFQVLLRHPPEDQKKPFLSDHCQQASLYRSYPVQFLLRKNQTELPCECYIPEKSEIKVPESAAVNRSD